MPREKSEWNLEEILDSINQLPPQQKAKLGQKLLGGSQAGLTVVLCENNMVSNQVALQLNASSEELSEVLKNVPPEVLNELLKAIATRMAASPENTDNVADGTQG